VTVTLSRSVTLGFPLIPLRGGPYDGENAGASHVDNAKVDSTAFFPDRVVVHGAGGPAVYALESDDDGRFGRFSHVGTE
jgi:hypothetical protein